LGALATAAILIPGGWLYLRSLPPSKPAQQSPAVEARSMLDRVVTELKSDQTAALEKFNNFDVVFYRYTTYVERTQGCADQLDIVLLHCL
jgi:hypothetical protein